MDIVTYKMAQKYTKTAVQNVNNAVTELDNRLATNETEILRRALITETGNKIELEINNQTYILTAKLYDKNNNLISTSNSIDLPLEAMIINATYNNNTKKIVLTLQSGSTVEFSIVDLIDGLVNETTFNETIEELEAENIKLKQRVTDLENNESTNTVSGESIDIYDSANAENRGIKVTGKTWQNTTTGKNKLNVPSEFSFTEKTDFPLKLSAGTYHITCDDVVKEGAQNPCIIINDRKYELTSNLD